MFQTSCHSDASRGGFANRAFVARARRVGALHVCILVVALFAASIVQARVETILWTHSLDHVAGFRMYLSARPGPSGSVGIADIAIAEAAQNQGGVFFHSINVPDEETVYITMTAYSDETVESIRSNEKILAPPVISDSEVDGVPAPDDPTRFEFTTPVSPYPVNMGASADELAGDGRTWTRCAGLWNTGFANTVAGDTKILGTNVPAVYQSSRTDPASGDEMKHSFPLPNEAYRVRLHFAEHIHSAVQQCIFERAGRRLHSAVVRNISVDVADGSPKVEFIDLPGRSDPTGMGIEVVRRVALEGEVLTRPGKPVVLKLQ
jgi:hypothetical protein